MILLTLGDGIRRNLSYVSDDEKKLFVNALVELNRRLYPGSRNDTPLAGGVSYWFKQDEIHQATHVHGEPDFLPWHRELCNRLEALLRGVDPDLSLHYWDWTTDPRDLFTSDLMGNSIGAAGEPWLSARYYVPTASPDRDSSRNPADPPRDISRNVRGSPPFILSQDNNAISASTYPSMRSILEGTHGGAHGYIGGTLRDPHISFRDPFVFLLHSNVDRIFAMWQLQPGQRSRLDPNQVYGSEGSHPYILANLEPWAGNIASDPRSLRPARPWAPPENEHLLPENVKNSKHPTLVRPPIYDSLVWLVGDSSGDGRSDALYGFESALGNGRNIYSLRSNGDGTFNVRALVPWAGYAIPNGVWLVGDFTGDRRADILHAVQLSDYTHPWLSNGDGTFNVLTFRPWAGYGIPNGLWLVGDFNGDGRADILHAVRRMDYVHPWLSNGDGTFDVRGFRPWAGYGIPNGVWLVGDFNGDGRADVLHAVRGSDYVHVWLSNGDGTFNVLTFRPWAGYGIPNGLWMVGDFNGDGRADILHAVHTANYIHVWLSNGDGTFDVRTFNL